MEYKYRLTVRPFGFGTHPSEEYEFLRYEQDGHFGIVVYSKPLPIEKMINYSLNPITELLEYQGKTVLLRDKIKLRVDIVQSDREKNYVKLTSDDNISVNKSAIEFLKGIENKTYILQNTGMENKIYYTSAPINYDGFGTTTIETTDWFDANNRQVRKVSIPKEALANNWQTIRYSSGNYPAYEEQEFFDTIEKYDGIFTKKSVEKKEEINAASNKKNIIESILPKGGELKGVTVINISDDGDELAYGTQTNKTLITAKGLSIEDLKQEIKFESRVLEKSKKEYDEFDENEIRNSRVLSFKEKDDAIKMHKMTALNNEQVEKIVIPFFTKHLEILISENETEKKEEIKEDQKQIELVNGFLPTSIFDKQETPVAVNSLEDKKIQNPEPVDLSYIPQSENCTTVDTIIPKEMRSDMHRAIATVDRRVNGVDDYVAEKLGYVVGNCSLEQRKEGLKCLCDAFSAEQVDAIAVAIFNIEQKQQGCIIGDQTGIGKGRIAAGMVRYAVQRGIKPIFITEKPNLFSDFFRDVINIGSDDGIPLQILTGTKLVPKKVVKKTKEELEEEDEDDDINDLEEQDEEDMFEEKEIYTKNKQYPKYTYQIKDENGIEKTVTKEGKIFLRPFIVNGTNEKAIIKDVDGNILYKGSAADVATVIGKSERLETFTIDEKTGKKKFDMRKVKGTFIVPSEFNFIIATYSQFRGVTRTLKMDFLLEMARNNVVIMDESHNASGKSNVGAYLREVLEATLGVTFLSATFAKRPDNMPIYAGKTSLSDANMTNDELVNAILQGGVALQEIVSSNLVAEGQMIRRARSFEGIEINYEYLDASQIERGFPNLDLEVSHSAIMDNATSIIRMIMDFQKVYINPLIEKMDRENRGRYKQIHGKKGGKDAGVDNTPIFNGIFNVINQLLFSIKAEAVADVAIQRLKEGKKPVIAFASTMESFLNTIMKDDGEIASEGDIVNSDFGKIFEKRLLGVLRYVEKDPETGEAETKYIDISEESPELRVEYRRIMKRINESSVGICSSPIDALVNRIEKAGFSTVEVTGRKRQMKIMGDNKGQIVSRKITSANDAFRQFNNNTVDCLLINQSGSTGASAHAVPNSKVPKDQVKQRVMIILQAELNVNTEVQKRGRINRTGQILKPIFDYVISAIPSEKRLMMMLQKKLKSLDANTQSSQEDEAIAVDEKQVDFLDKYGDEIVTAYLLENPTFNLQIGDPCKLGDLTPKELEKGKIVVADAAHKVSGRVAILSVKDQEDFYNEIITRYISEVNLLHSTGEYDLKVKKMKLYAKTIEKEIIVAGTGGGKSVFSKNSILEKCEVANTKVPYKKDELDNLIRKGLDGYDAMDLKNSLMEKHRRFVQFNLENDIKDHEEYYDNLIKEIENETAAGKAENIYDYVRNRTYQLQTAKSEGIDRIRKVSDNKSRIVQRLFSFFTVGRVVGYPNLSYNVDKSFSYAVFVGFALNDKVKNPYAPSQMQMKFVIAGSQRYVALPASKFEITDAITSLTYDYVTNTIQQNTIDNWNEVIKSKSQDRIYRYIVTGNILQAYSKEEFRGSLIVYNTIDDLEKRGILLPEGWSKDGNGKKAATKITVPILKALPIIKTMIDGRTIETNDEFSITRTNYGYKIFTSAVAAKGAKFFLDPIILAMTTRNNFDKVGTKMEANIDYDKIEELVTHLQNAYNLSVALIPQEFEKIKDSIEDDGDEDEGKIPESEGFIQGLSEGNKMEEERRLQEEANKRFEEEQRQREKELAEQEEAKKDGDAFEIAKKRLAAKKKMMNLMRVLLNKEIIMAKGGNIDKYSDLKEQAYQLGVEAYLKGKGNAPAANKEFMDLIFKGPMKDDFNEVGNPEFLNVMKFYTKGHYDENHKEVVRMFPEMYKNNK